MTNPPKSQPQSDMNRLLREAAFGRDHVRQEQRRRRVAERLGFRPARPSTTSDRSSDDQQS